MMAKVHGAVEVYTHDRSGARVKVYWCVIVRIEYTRPLLGA